MTAWRGAVSTGFEPAIGNWLVSINVEATKHPDEAALAGAGLSGEHDGGYGARHGTHCA